MDPNACLRQTFQHLAEQDFAEAFYLLNDLIGWLKGGGFIPECLPQNKVDAVAALSHMRRAIKAMQGE